MKGAISKQKRVEVSSTFGWPIQDPWKGQFRCIQGWLTWWVWSFRYIQCSRFEALLWWRRRTTEFEDKLFPSWGGWWGSTPRGCSTSRGHKGLPRTKNQPRCDHLHYTGFILHMAQHFDVRGLMSWGFVAKLLVFLERVESVLPNKSSFIPFGCHLLIQTLC